MARKVTAVVQADIAAALGDKATPALTKAASAQYRATDLGIADIVGALVAVESQGDTTKATRKGRAAARKATEAKGDDKAQPKAGKATSGRKAKGDKAKGDDQPKAEKAVAVVPAGFVATKGDAVGSFVRYARRLRNGSFVTEYDTAAADDKAAVAKVSAWRKQGHDGRYVVVDHTADTVESFGTHSAAYAYSMALQQGAANLAPSTLASLGKRGLAAIGQ